MSAQATTPEQRARDLLERMGVPGAQRYTSGNLGELAGLLDAADYALEVLNRDRGKQARLRAIQRLQAALRWSVQAS